MFNKPGRFLITHRKTHLLLGGVVDGCQGDEPADVLSIFLKNDVIPEDEDSETWWGGR